MKVLKHDHSQHHGIGILPTVPVNRTRKGLPKRKTRSCFEPFKSSRATSDGVVANVWNVRPARIRLGGENWALDQWFRFDETAIG